MCHNYQKRYCFFISLRYAELPPTVHDSFRFSYLYYNRKHANQFRTYEKEVVNGLMDLVVLLYPFQARDVSRAIDSCIVLNQWHEAVDLATRYNQPSQISGLLAKYAEHLLSERKTMQAIELFRKANYYLEGAQLLNQIAREETSRRANPMRIKQIYVLAALLVEEYQKNMKISGGRSSASLSVLGGGDGSKRGVGSNDRVTLDEAFILDDAWKGAEGFHFLMLCQRQLYDGYVDSAMKTALNLREYEGVLQPEDIYSLLALASCANRAFGTCSKAFIRLECMEEISASQRTDYQELAMDIFIKQAPKDSRSNRAECTSCETMIPDW